MPAARELWFPFSILLTTCVVFTLFLPFFPVDETRYLSVAWEMWLHDSIALPLQNALPYSHKPPLFFWLVNLDWWLLGVNEWSLRFIPLAFSLLNVCLVYRIAMQLWEDREAARYAVLVLSSTLSYLVWSCVIMFDTVLAFWVLLAVSGVIRAGQTHRTGAFALTGIALGGGVLTKGPVTLVYVLPVALFAFWWIPAETFHRRWYLRLALSLALGAVLVIAWVVPAALAGGDGYRRAILWGQTVNRMANSFAHQRPPWWYLPWLPLLLLPWALLPGSWRGCLLCRGDAGRRLLLIWIVSALAILSLLSGKQVHYLIPLLPAFSLLIGRNLAAAPPAATRRFLLPVSLFYLAAGATLLSLFFSGHGRLLTHFDPAEARRAACGFLLLGVVLALSRPRTMAGGVWRLAASSLPFSALVVVGGNALFDRYDLRPISEAVRLKQEAGYRLVHYGKYHGQYHFIGRLQRPLIELENKEELRRLARGREKVALINYEAQARGFDAAEVYFRQPFRSRQVVLRNRRGIESFLDGTPGHSGDAE